MELKKEKSIKNNLSKKIQSWLIKAKQVKNLSNKNSISSSKAYNVKGITLIALVITMVLHYDKVKKCSNSNSFLLSSI